MDWETIVRNFKIELENEINRTPTGERRELLTDAQIMIGRIEHYDKTGVMLKVE
jgi:hypothetical protein